MMNRLLLSLSGPTNKTFAFLFSIMICGFALIAEPVFAAKHAAKVIYAFGSVNAVAKSGSRTLSKGDLVYSGETVSTTRGRAQIKFTDGGFASLQPNTDYEIDDYNFEGKADGNERSFLNLLKGSVRLVTGVIGKANRRNFRIKTAVATIGIRGTQGTIVHDPTTNKTLLKGYGGEWDLVSGSFSGGVKPGQSYSCDGVSCASISGVSQRSDVRSTFGFSSEEEEENIYQQGQQVDDEGVICGLGGDCGDLAVTVDQHAAVAGTVEGEVGLTGATDFLEGVGVVAVGEKPVAIVGDGRTDGGPSAALVATDVNAVRTAVNQFGEEDPEFVLEANQFLDALDPSLLADLESNPASVAEEDFGTSPDGLVTFGRWVNGNVLVAFTDFSPSGVAQRLDTLEGFESFHFIYGDDLPELTFTGTGIYTLTGGTFPTAVDGSTIGLIPTSGSLTWNFGTGDGTIGMLVRFDSIDFTIAGTIGVPDAGDLVDPGLPKIFAENVAAATFFAGGIPMTAPVTLNGFFTGANGAGAPLAAGVAYEVDYYANPFVGTAAFGLASQQLPVATIIPEATIKYALIYFDSTGMVPASISNGDQLPMGTPLDNFTTSFGDGFTLASGSILESGSDATTGAHWRRFGSGYNFTSGALPPGAMLNEDFHAIKTDYTTPDQVIMSTTGTSTFMYAGGTSPTMVYDIGSLTYVQTTGSITQADFVADFTNGVMSSINFAGSFPSVSSGTFVLNSTGPVSINSGTATFSGSFSDTGSINTAGCMGGCALGGLVNYAFTSATAGGPPVGVISSFNATGTGINLFHIAGSAFSN